MFLFSITCRPALGPTQPPVQWVQEEVPPGGKRLGREADHSILGRGQEWWRYTSTLQYVFMA
jgi:hypothetical protein